MQFLQSFYVLLRRRNQRRQVGIRRFVGITGYVFVMTNQSRIGEQVRGGTTTAAQRCARLRCADRVVDKQQNMKAKTSSQFDIDLRFDRRAGTSRRSLAARRIVTTEAVPTFCSNGAATDAVVVADAVAPGPGHRHVEARDNAERRPTDEDERIRNARRDPAQQRSVVDVSRTMRCGDRDLERERRRRRPHRRRGLRIETSRVGYAYHASMLHASCQLGWAHDAGTTSNPPPNSARRSVKAHEIPPDHAAGQAASVARFRRWPRVDGAAGSPRRLYVAGCSSCRPP